MSGLRVVYKASGASLAGRRDAPGAVAVDRYRFVARELAALHERGHEVLVSVGGGNLFRGSDAHVWPMGRADADEVGMIATAMNARLLESVLRDRGLCTTIVARGSVEKIGEPWSARRVTTELAAGTIVVAAGGVGLPFVSSDYAAVHHAVEVNASRVLAAKTGTDGVYDVDPNVNPRARKFSEISCSTIIRSGIEVMDFAAIDLARRFGVRVDVFSARARDAAVHAINGDPFDGTVITPD